MMYLYRFTPTRVGKSADKTAFAALTPVHPHTCGEIIIGFLQSLAPYGSPPHVWGNLPIPTP